MPRFKGAKSHLSPGEPGARPNAADVNSICWNYTLPAISETVNGFTGDTLTAYWLCRSADTTGCIDVWAAYSIANAPSPRDAHSGSLDRQRNDRMGWIC